MEQNDVTTNRRGRLSRETKEHSKGIHSNDTNNKRKYGQEKIKGTYLHNSTLTTTSISRKTMNDRESDQSPLKNHLYKGSISNNTNTEQAVFLFNDGNLQKQHPQLSSTTPAPAWYEPCQTTLLLILVLHLVFLQQWNTKRTKKDTLASYRILIQHKHYYRAILAFLSHPPVNIPTTTTTTTTSTSSASSTTSLDVHMGTDDWRERGTATRRADGHRRTRFIPQYARDNAIVRRWYPILRSTFIQPFWYGHLSGLPLLIYNCHILWSCRALERSLVDSSAQYARTLLGLAMVALLLELRSSFYILKSPLSVAGNILPGPALLGTQQQQFIQRTRQRILHRSIGTPTMLTSSLLVVFRQTFRYVPLQVLPFVRVLPTSVADPTLCFYLSMLLLMVLSWRTCRSVTGVFYGFISGLAWSWCLTSFLGEPTWSFCVVLTVVILTAISMHSSSPSSLAMYVPCVDYVAWDHQGALRGQGDTTYDNNNNIGALISLASDADTLDAEGDIESRPLLLASSSRRRTSIEVEEVDEQGTIHGRLPLMTMDSDIVDDRELFAGNGRHSPLSGLSRRGGL